MQETGLRNGAFGADKFGFQDLAGVHWNLTEPALYEVDFSPEGFEWIDCNDAEASTIAFLRRPRRDGAVLAVACNFTPVPRVNYVLGVPFGGSWRELLNSDAREYGGAGWGNLGGGRSASGSTP